MQGLIEEAKTTIYLERLTVIVIIGAVSLLALLVLYRLLYGTGRDSLSRPRAAGAALLLAVLLVLPLPIMLLFRPGVSAREAVGEILYRDECAVCHGGQGNRLPGVPLGSAEFLQQLGDAGMEKVIKEGKGVMPAWGRDHEGPFSEEQIHMVIDYLKSAAEINGPVAATAATPSPAPSGPVSADAGKALFANNCVACHGANGGRIPAAKLSSKSFLDALDDTALAGVVRDGKASMPAFGLTKGGTLSEGDIQSVVAFLRALAHEP